MKMLCIARCVMPVTKDEIFGEMAESTGCGGLKESHQQKTRLSSRPSTAPSRSAPRLAQLGGCPCPLPPQHASPLAPSSTAQFVAPHQLRKALPDSHALLKNIKKKKKKTNGQMLVSFESMHCFNLLKKDRDTPAPHGMLAVQVKKALKV